MTVTAIVRSLIFQNGLVIKARGKTARRRWPARSLFRRLAAEPLVWALLTIGLCAACFGFPKGMVG